MLKLKTVNKLLSYTIYYPGFTLQEDLQLSNQLVGLNSGITSPGFTLQEHLQLSNQLREPNSGDG